MAEFLADVLEEYMALYDQTTGRLAKLSDVPKPTLQSWREGRVKRPRHIDPILQVAKALHLTVEETNRLLTTTKHPSLATIHQTAASENNEMLLSLLSFWQEQFEDKDERPPLTLRTALRKPFQVPPKITDFVGRTNEIEEITGELKTKGTICVLQGMGGVGKSTLANHLAYRLRHHFEDGILWGTVSHGRADDSHPHQHAMTILRDFSHAYGVDVSEYSDIEQRSRIVLHLLASKKTLIILDDVLGTEDTRYLLPASTAHCSTLITTRNKKMLNNRASTHSITSFTYKDCFALLSQIIGETRVEHEKKDAADLIQFVGGLPLALRIIGSAIAEAGWLTLNEYGTLLQNEQSRLTHLADWEDASKNVRASFELSYNRLEPNLQSLFQQLALFSGHDFSAAALAAITKQPIPLIKINLGRLHALSLLNFNTADPNTPTEPQARYHLHPLLRVFAREKLGQPNPAQKQLFAAYYASFVNDYGFDQYDMLDREWENTQTAVEWANENGWDEQLYHLINGLTQMSLGLTGYIDSRGYKDKGIAWLQQCLDTPFVQQNKLFSALCYMKLGAFAIDSAQTQWAIKLLKQGHDLISEPTNEQEAICYAYICHRLGVVSINEDIEEHLAWYQNGIDCLEQFNSPSSRHLQGWLSVSQGSVWGQSGNMEQAYKLTLMGMDLLPSHAKSEGYMNLANIATYKGDFDKATYYREKVLTHAQKIGNSRIAVKILRNQAVQMSFQGKFARSVELFEQSIEQYQLIMNVRLELLTLSQLASILYILGQEARAFKIVNSILETKNKTAKSQLLALMIRSRMKLHTRQVTEASRDLDEAETIVHQYQDPVDLANIWRVRAQVAIVENQFDNAIALIQRSLAVDTYNLYKGMSLYVKGDALTGLQQYEEAMAAYEQSLQTLDEGMRFEYARTLTKVAQLKWIWKQDDSVVGDLEEILEAFVEMGAVHEIASVQKLLDEINDKR